MRNSYYELNSAWRQRSETLSIERSQSVKSNTRQNFVRNDVKRRSFLGITSSLPVSMINEENISTRSSKKRLKFTRRHSNKSFLLPERAKEVLMDGVLMPGECVVSQVDFVRHVSPYKEKDSEMEKQSIRGTLFSTNFRLIFLSSEEICPASLQLSNENYWRNVPDFFSLPQGNIHTFSSLVKGGIEFKQLNKNTKTMKLPEEILITCKDCKRVRFVLSESPPGQIKQFIQGTMHHMQPLDVTKLFAVDLGRQWNPIILSRGEVKVPSYEDMCDWENEIQKLKLGSWRVSSINSNFEISPTLPPYLICPLMVSDKMLIQTSEIYRLGRFPTLSYCTQDGCFLMRSAYLLPDFAGLTQVYLSQMEHNYVSSCLISDLTSPLDSPERTEYERMDLGDDMPSLARIQASYLQMMEAVHEEERWLSAVEDTQWMELASDCLFEASLVVELLTKQKKHVLLTEPDGRDLTPLISTLVQLLCDPESRTLIGFESLIQREWVAYGHPFNSRLKHTVEQREEEDYIGFCPVFFLMLDCVWQIMTQFPTSFEFNSQYLLMVAQEVCSCVSSTFLFDSIQHKQEALETLEGNSDATLLYPFWQLSRVMYPIEQTESTLNPLYCLRQTMRSNRDMYSLIEECLSLFSTRKGPECGLRRTISLHSLGLLSSTKLGSNSKVFSFINKAVISAISDNVLFQPLEDTLCPKVDLIYVHLWKDFFVSTTWDLENGSQNYTSMVEREIQKLVKRILNLYHTAIELQSMLPSTPPPELPSLSVEALSQTSSEVSSVRDSSSLELFNDSNSNRSSSPNSFMNDMSRAVSSIPPTASYIKPKVPQIIRDKDMSRNFICSRKNSQDNAFYKIPFRNLTECAEALYALKREREKEIMCLDMKVTREEFADV